MPEPPPHIHIASYADDVTITSTHSKPNVCTEQAQQYLETLSHWLTQNRLKVAPAKSTSTLITNYSKEHQYRPTLTLNNSPIPHTHEAKILGVTYNTSMSFAPHINNITTKTSTRLNALRALSGTQFGKDKETLTLVYKQYIRTVLSYAGPAWAPTLSNTQLHKLQTTQNKALRIITGCTQSTPIDHLHNETKILPIQTHLDMRGTQFLAAAANNTLHPCHYMDQHPPTPRNIVKTPHSYYTNILQTIPPPPGRTSLTKHIHTALTSRQLDQTSNNKVLGHPPPPVSSTESHLERRERVHLARFRCGHHTSLNTYKHRIGLHDTPTCPSCQAAPHTITHILTECTAWQALRQTHNIDTPLQLWTDPLSVASFLRGAGLM